MQAAAVKVFGRVDPRERYKLQGALKYCKSKLTDCRSEEGRKVWISLNTPHEDISQTHVSSFSHRFWDIHLIHKPAIYQLECLHGNSCDKYKHQMT